MECLDSRFRGNDRKEAKRTFCERIKISCDLNTPLPVEDPERFYRSGEKRKHLIAAEQSIF